MPATAVAAAERRGSRIWNQFAVLQTGSWPCIWNDARVVQPPSSQVCNAEPGGSTEGSNLSPLRDCWTDRLREAHRSCRLQMRWLWPRPSRMRNRLAADPLAACCSRETVSLDATMAPVHQVDSLTAGQPQRTIPTTPHTSAKKAHHPSNAIDPARVGRAW